MDSQWTAIVQSWLQFPEEVGAVFLSPTHAEVWKGSAHHCPYFKQHQAQQAVVVHTHPTQEKYNPPSPTDLINCIQSPNPHIVLAKEGFWSYSASAELKEEWGALDPEKRNSLMDILTNNCFGVTAQLLGGAFTDMFAEGVPKTPITVGEYVSMMKQVVPRKDPTLPPLGFHITLHKSLPSSGVVFDPSYQLMGYEWDAASAAESLTERIAAAKSGECVTSDGSYVVF